MQQCNNLTIQQFTIKKSNNPSIQQFNNATIQTSNNSTIQKFNNSNRPKNSSIWPKKLVLCGLSLAQISPLLFIVSLDNTYRLYSLTLFNVCTFWLYYWQIFDPVHPLKCLLLLNVNILADFRINLANQHNKFL